MIEHVIRAVIALCDRLLVLDFGKMIAEGTPKEIATNYHDEACSGRELEARNAQLEGIPLIRFGQGVHEVSLESGTG